MTNERKQKRKSFKERFNTFKRNLVKPKKRIIAFALAMLTFTSTLTPAVSTYALDSISFDHSTYLNAHYSTGNWTTADGHTHNNTGQVSNLDNNVDNDEWYKLLFDYEEYSAMINIRHLLYEVAQKALRDKFPIENYFVMGRPIHSFKDKTYFIRFCNQADHNREIIFLINHFEEPLKRAIPYKRVNGNLQACKTCWEAVKEG